MSWILRNILASAAQAQQDEAARQFLANRFVPRGDASVPEYSGISPRDEKLKAYADQIRQLYGGGGNTLTNLLVGPQPTGAIEAAKFVLGADNPLARTKSRQQDERLALTRRGQNITMRGQDQTLQMHKDKLPSLVLTAKTKAGELAHKKKKYVDKENLSKILKIPGGAAGLDYANTADLKNYFIRQGMTTEQQEAFDLSRIPGKILDKAGGEKSLYIPSQDQEKIIQSAAEALEIDAKRAERIADVKTTTETRRRMQVEAQEKARIGFNEFVLQTNRAIDRINGLDEALQDTDLLSQFAGKGTLNLLSYLPGTKAHDYVQRLVTLKGTMGAMAYETLRGAAAITEFELKTATDALINLNRAQTPQQLRAALQDLRGFLSMRMQIQERIKDGNFDPIPNQKYATNEQRADATSRIMKVQEALAKSQKGGGGGTGAVKEVPQELGWQEQATSLFKSAFGLGRQVPRLLPTGRRRRNIGNEGEVPDDRTAYDESVMFARGQFPREPRLSGVGRRRKATKRPKRKYDWVQYRDPDTGQMRGRMVER